MLRNKFSVGVFMLRPFQLHASRKDHHLRCSTMAPGRRAISYRILTTYEKAFEKLGFSLAHKPWRVLLPFVLLLFACCLGFIRLSIKQPSSNDFTVTASQSRLDFHDAAQFFSLLEARQEQIVMTPKHSEDILSEDCLRDVVSVHQTIVNINGFQKLCFKQPSRRNNVENPAIEDCVIMSPLEFAGTNFEHLSNLTSILAREWTNSTRVLSTGQSFHSSFKQMLSGFKVENGTHSLTARADAIRVTYLMRKATSEEDQEIFHFESSFESSALSIQRHLKCVSLAFKTGKASDDVLKSVLQPKLIPLYFSGLVIVFVAFISIYLSSRNVSLFATFLLILFSVLLPLICAVGIVSMVNISFFPTTLFIPFLLMGKVTSDVVIYLQKWEQHNEVPSLEHRVSSCVVRAGIPLTLSAICGAAVSGVAIRSSFTVISQFFLGALVTYVIVSVGSFTTAETLLLHFERQAIRTKNTVWTKLFMRRSSFYNLGDMTGFCRRIKWMLLSIVGKVLSFFLVACIITTSVLFILKPGERMSTTVSLYHQNDNFNQFIEVQKRFFGSETDVSIVFSDGANYSKPAVQDRVIDICKSLQNSALNQRGSDCWMVELLKWAKHQNMSCSNLEFYPCLNTFLNHFEGAHFRQDLRFKDNHPPYQILASRIHVKMARQHLLKEDRRSLEILRDAVPKQSLLKAAPVSETFFELDDLFVLKKETFFILLITTVVVFVLTLFSCTSVWLSTCITGSFMLLLLEAAAILKASGVLLNHITFITLLFTIIMALNFSLHVVYLDIFSRIPSTEQRMVEGFCSAGLSVFTSALLELSGSVALGFIFPRLQDIFFRLIPTVFALGCIHAVVILPPIITLFVKSLKCLKNELDAPDIETESILLQVQHGERQQGTPKHPGISIIGISCRFPGANSKDMFWGLLEQGKSSFSAFPQNRVDQHKKFFQLYHPKRFVSGRHCAISGSYMEEIKHFDNKFFGISNQEAREMDPQQRILLEVVYEAIEDSGMRLEDLQECKTGVFVGLMNLEFSARLTESSNYRNIDQFCSTGMTASIVANRLSFCFNLTGPSIAVDTACSSSLTALKIACDSLRNDDCDIAIVCAPNIILDHAMQMVSSMAGLLAPDGRCKSFDASGDGYGRGEGFAAILLKLSQAALSDKDDVYCEIIACGMNNDGQNAIPITAPCAKTQAELSRSVLEQSGVTAEEVDYFEAHGTGTAIGDVVEVTSIADTYTKAATNSTGKLRIGSVKSNLNHTESTSGLAGLD